MPDLSTLRVPESPQHPGCSQLSRAAAPLPYTLGGGASPLGRAPPSWLPTPPGDLRPGQGNGGQGERTVTARWDAHLTRKSSAARRALSICRTMRAFPTALSKIWAGGRCMAGGSVGAESSAGAGWVGGGTDKGLSSELSQRGVHAPGMAAGSHLPWRGPRGPAMPHKSQRTPPQPLIRESLSCASLRREPESPGLLPTHGIVCLAQHRCKAGAVPTATGDEGT